MAIMTKNTLVIKKDDQIRRKYFLWLCDIVDTSESKEDRANLELLWWLHNHEFGWSVPNDDNRIEDGKNLRYEFYEDNLIRNSVALDGPCSVFEVMVALALRMDYIVSNTPDVHEVPKYFWEMIDNLKLKVLINPSTNENESKLSIFLRREYGANGIGGLFPLKNPRRDQRKVELWYQLMAYVEENYG